MLTITNALSKVFLGLLLMPVGAVKGIAMDDKIHHKIAEAVHEEFGWKVEEARVDEVESLRRPSCSFYTVVSNQRPLAYEPNYALLSGDQVVGIGTANAVTKILDGCSADASADWWAEIITRFHPDLGGGLVLSDEEERPDIVRKLGQAGMKFTPPQFDHDKQGVNFLLLDPETYRLYRVHATRDSSGGIEVKKTKLLGSTPNAQTKSDPMDAIAETLQ
jgi:hypothetical protein